MASAHRSRFFRIFNQFHYIPPSAIGIDFGSTNTTLSVPLRSFYPKANRSADSLLLALNCDGNNHTPTRLFYDPSTRNYFVGNASDNPRSLTGFKEALPSHLQHIAAFLHTLLSSLTGVDGLPPSLPSMPECAHISIVSIPPPSFSHSISIPPINHFDIVLSVPLHFTPDQITGIRHSIEQSLHPASLNLLYDTSACLPASL